VPDEAEVPAIARVRRSRLAFALAVTVAAVPVLVLDNLPATAETNDDHVAVQTSADAAEAWEPFTLVTPEPSTTATEAPTTTAAAETTVTAAPTTTEAPPVVQAMRAPEPPPTTAPPTTAAPAPTRPPSSGADPNDPATWDRLADCESNGNWGMDSGNGYYGGLQFSVATWRNVGGAGYPHEASRSEQIKRGKILQARAGWDQWPSCARLLGYY
jgi:hypothetical protein